MKLSHQTSYSSIDSSKNQRECYKYLLKVLKIYLEKQH